MTGSERKRVWRLAHPEQSARAERERALARRRGFWGDSRLGVTPRLCASRESYWRYENSWPRLMQRLWWPKLGAGAHRLTKKERGKAITTWGNRKRAEFAVKFAAP